MSLTKLIFWLSGLLLAIITMNVTVYLALTGVFLAIGAVRRRQRKMIASALGLDRDRDRDRSSDQRD